MSLEICSCEVSSTRNTGLSSCFNVQGEAKMLIMQRIYDDAGVLNMIPKATTFDDAYVSSMINNADQSKRWYPVGKFVEVDMETAENNTFTRRDSSIGFLGEGASTFKGMLEKYPAQYKSVLDSYRCSEWGAYVIDREGKPFGYIKDDAGVYPRPISPNSAAGRFVHEVQNSSLPMLEFTFTWDVSVNDACTGYIANAATGLLTSSGLVDVYAFKADGTEGVDVASSTQFSFYAKHAFGGANSGYVTGLVSGDFVLTNETTGLAVVVTMVEGANGLYTGTILAQTTNDVLRLSGLTTAYDLEKLGNASFLAL